MSFVALYGQWVCYSTTDYAQLHTVLTFGIKERRH